VNQIIRRRLPASIGVSLASLFFVYLLAIPIGTYSATNQYSFGDYIATAIGFVGLAIPNFFLALILLYAYYNATGQVAIGFYSQEFQHASFSLAKLWDLLKHLWIPTVVIGTAGTCGLIRVMRANLLDELKKPYVIVARAKGVPRRKLLYKYPFRIAVNPIISTLGWLLPTLVSGELLVSLVLSIPTLAPVFLNAILSQDMFLAASSVMILSTLTVIGTLLSDILLAWVDPRIREAV
jgi:peptide/nickel transport system permease protein